MSIDLFNLADSGDLEQLCNTVAEAAEASDEEDGPDERVFQWLQVAAALGSDEADDLADDIYESALSRGGDEVVAVLHYEVAEWFIRGTFGVTPNIDMGLAQLAAAQGFQLRETVELDDELRALRAELHGAHQQEFDALFPGLETLDEPITP